MPFRITTKNGLQFTLRRRTVDSAKEKLKGKFLKGMISDDLFTRWQMTAYINSSTVIPMTDYRRQLEMFSLLILGRFAKHSRG